MVWINCWSMNGLPPPPQKKKKKKKKPGIHIHNNVASADTGPAEQESCDYFWTEGLNFYSMHLMLHKMYTTSAKCKTHSFVLRVCTKKHALTWRTDFAYYLMIGNEEYGQLIYSSKMVLQYVLRWYSTNVATGRQWKAIGLRANWRAYLINQAFFVHFEKT